jgi:hypothetical protein
MQEMQRSKASKSELQLDDFFLENSEMYSFCVAIQLCLISGWQPETLKNKVFNILEKEFRDKNKNLGKEHKKAIKDIFRNIIDVLNSHEQKTLFLKQIPAEFFAFYLYDPAAKLCRNEDLIEKFQEKFIAPVIEYFGELKSKNEEMLLDQLKPGLIICQEKLTALNEVSYQIKLGYLYMFLIMALSVFCFYQIAFSEKNSGKSLSDIFTLTSILNLFNRLGVGKEIAYTLPVLFGLYVTRKKISNEYTIGQWQTFIKNETMQALNKVTIFDPDQPEKEPETVYLPMDRNKANLQLQRLPTTNSTAITNSTEAEPATPKIKRKHTAAPPAQPSFIGRFFGAPVLVWPGTAITGGFAGNVFANDRNNVRPMKGKKPNDFHAFYSFFNRRELLTQLDPESEEFTSYDSQWNKSKITEKTKEAGCKELNPRYRIKHDLYDWEIKILNKLYRCVGKNASTVLDASGKAHTLVDFCTHLDKGPGKGRGFK